MTNIQAILSRENCGSNHYATGVYQGDVLGPRYRVRVDPRNGLFCVIDRSWLREWLSFDIHDPNDWYGAEIKIEMRFMYWQSFDDALAFVKLLEKLIMNPNDAKELQVDDLNIAAQAIFDAEAKR